MGLLPSSGLPPLVGFVTSAGFVTLLGFVTLIGFVTGFVSSILVTGRVSSGAAALIANLASRIRRKSSYLWKLYDEGHLFGRLRGGRGGAVEYIMKQLEHPDE